MLYDVFFFFFSSRRRHTRLQGDWSSDVCSSDLWRGRTTDTAWPRPRNPSTSRARVIATPLISGGYVSLTTHTRRRERGTSRSEERRVGKEGRSRWSPDH